jgi:2-oxo-3-hexenedioate decarboxylase
VPLSPDDIDACAALLDDAARAARAIPQLTTGRGEGMTLADAYAIQLAGIDLRKLRRETLVGMKMGLTSRAKMQQMGVDTPIYGHLTSAMILDDGGVVDRAAHCHPRVEPEIAFVLARDLHGPATPAQAMAAVGGVAAALELIDSRYQDFKFTLADVVADNASSSRFVLGSTLRTPSDLAVGGYDVGNLAMVMEVNGRAVEIGSSAAIYEHPARSLAALANQLHAEGEHLQAGMIVMTGGATAAVAVAPGDHVRVRVDGLGLAELFIAKP